MSRNSLAYIISFGFLSLLTSSCGSNSPNPSNSASPTPSVNAASPAPAIQPVASASPAFSKPAVSPPVLDKDGKPVATNTSIGADIAAGLIPLTDSEAATKAVTKGRTDPFAAVIAQPVVAVAPSSRTVVQQPSQPTAGAPAEDRTSQSPITRSSKVGTNLGAASIAEMAKKAAMNNSKVALVPKQIPANNTSSTTKVKEAPAIGPLLPQKTAIRSLPSAAPVLEPELSKSIKVTGVADINGQTHVIVQLPGETFSRYISVGERILNGKVLIKRVQDRTAIAPIVVFEEVGIEVYRRVGEKSLASSKDAPNPSAAPVPPLVPVAPK